MNKSSIRIAIALLAIGILPPASAQTTGDQGQAAPAAPAAAASPAASPAASSTRVIVGRDMSYSNPSSISKAVLTECQLPQQGAQLLMTAMRSAGFDPVIDDQAAQAGKGRVLLVQISNAIASGNAFIGHRKQVDVRGRLMEDGKEVASFTGTRSSMGGAFGGFKGSCSVLGRCLETLSKDIATWMKAPMTGRIGE